MLPTAVGLHDPDLEARVAGAVRARLTAGEADLPVRAREGGTSRSCCGEDESNGERTRHSKADRRSPKGADEGSGVEVAAHVEAPSRVAGERSTLSGTTFDVVGASRPFRVGSPPGRRRSAATSPDSVHDGPTHAATTLRRMSGQPLPIFQVVPAGRDLVRRARLLAWVGLGWHIVEAAVAIVAGVVA